MTTLDSYLAKVRSQIGYAENAYGVTKYGQWWGTPDMDWCAAFLLWCAHQLAADGLLPRKTFTVEMARAFQADNRIGEQPRVGACVFFDWSGDRNRIDAIDHVALVEAVHADGTIGTIGGNEDSAVVRRRRSTAYVVTYGYPRYAGATVVHPAMVKLGNTGDTVKLLQRLLNERMATRLVVDGIFGSATYNAVVAFQRREGLAPDGVVGVATWTALGR